MKKILSSLIICAFAISSVAFATENNNAKTQNAGATSNPETSIVKKYKKKKKKKKKGHGEHHKKHKKHKEEAKEAETAPPPAPEGQPEGSMPAN